MRTQEENRNQILEAKKAMVNFRFGLDKTEYLIKDFGFGSTKTKFSKIRPNDLADLFYLLLERPKQNMAELFGCNCNLT